MAKAKATKKKATKTVAKKVETNQNENKGTLVPNMFIKEHTFKNGTTILNVSLKLPEFVEFCRENCSEDKNGSYWLNMKLLPSSNENRSHTPILNDYFHSDAVNLAQDVLVEDLEKEDRKQEAKLEGEELPF